MDARKKTRIERLTASLLRDYDKFSPGFDIVELIEEQGISYLNKNLGPKIYGASKVTSSVRAISVNSENSQNRQRFSAAHELGHVLLHQEKGLNISDRLLYKSEMFRDEKSSEGSDWREIEANFFAACLLMPKDLLEREIAKLGGLIVDEDELSELATIFKVSTVAMTIRLSSLGYI